MEQQTLSDKEPELQKDTDSIAKDNEVERSVKFEKNIRSFFNICRFINKAYQDKSLVVTQNFIFESFESFVNIYNKINDPLKTLPVFEEVYNSRKIKILSKNEDWISDRLIIEYPRVKKSKKKINILVSIFYAKAKELSETAHKEIYEFNNDKNADNLHLIQKLKLPLLRIFLLCCDDKNQNEKQMLEEYISELEDELPASSSSSSSSKPGVPNGPINPADLFANLGGMNLGSMISNMMGGMNAGQQQRGGRGRGRGGRGTKGRTTKKQTSSDENAKQKQEEGNAEGKTEEDVNIDEDMEKLEDMVGDVLSNPNVKNVAGTVIRKFKNADMSSMEGIGSVIGDLLGDEQLRESLINMMPQPITEEDAEDMINEASNVGEEGEAEDGEDNGDHSEGEAEEE
jgi:hypothetical protein